MKLSVAALVLLFSLIVGIFLVGTTKDLGLLRVLVDLKPDLTGGLPFLAENRTKYDRSNLPDLKGRIALVTGANKGLGFSTARFLAERGAKVILACRDLTACERVAAKSRGLGIARALDLSSLASVEAFASSIMKDFDRLDMLVLNAGMHPFEFSMTVNHVAHHLLFKRLRPLLVKTARMPDTKVSVVVVSSRSHFSSYPYGVSLNVTVLNDPTKFSFRQAYGQSKLANLLFAQQAAAQFKAEKIRVFVNSCHPGLVNTDISNPLAGKIAAMFGAYVPMGASAAEFAVSWVWDQLKVLMWTPEEGALTQTWLAAAPETTMKGLENTGLYYHPIMQVVEPNPWAKASSELRGQLWDFTEEYLQQKGF